MRVAGEWNLRPDRGVHPVCASEPGLRATAATAARTESPGGLLPTEVALDLFAAAADPNAADGRGRRPADFAGDATADVLIEGT